MKMNILGMSKFYLKFCYLNFFFKRDLSISGLPFIPLSSKLISIILHRVLASNQQKCSFPYHINIIKDFGKLSFKARKNPYLHKTTPKPMVQNPWRYYLIKPHDSSSWYNISFFSSWSKFMSLIRRTLEVVVWRTKNYVQ